MTPALTDLENDITMLEARLVKGSDILFAKEQAGEMEHPYRQWLGEWLKILIAYCKAHRELEAAQTPEQQALV